MMLMEQLLERFSDRWVELEGDNPEEFKVPIKVEQAFRKFAGKLPDIEIMEAIELTHERLEDRRTRDKVKYFCGICWRKLSRAEFIDGAGI